MGFGKRSQAFIPVGEGGLREGVPHLGLDRLVNKIGPDWTNLQSPPAPETALGSLFMRRFHVFADHAIPTPPIRSIDRSQPSGSLVGPFFGGSMLLAITWWLR